MKSTHRFLFLAVLVFGLFLGSTVISEDQVIAPSKEEAEKTGKLDSNSMSVVVCAFVVEVDNGMLYDNPADLIMTESDAMSIERVLGLIRANKGVKVGNFIRGICNSEGNFKVANHKNIRIEEVQGTRKTSRPYTINICFEATVSVSEDREIIFVNYALSKIDERPDEEANCKWNSNIRVSPDKPVVVSSNQEYDKTVLLIIKAGFAETLPQ